MGTVSKDEIEEFHLDTSYYKQGAPDDCNGAFAFLKAIHGELRIRVLLFGNGFAAVTHG